MKPFLRRVIRTAPARRFRAWLAEPDANGKAAAPAKVCFIHIPKTGGTYVSQHDNLDESVVSPLRNLGHATVVDPDWQLFWDVPAPFGEGNAFPRACLGSSFVFSNIRNPYSFFVSYLHHAAGRMEQFRNPHHYDFVTAKKGFDYLLKTIADRDAPWPSRKLVHYQLFAQPSGAPAVDWINCTASLDSHLLEMANAFGLHYRQGRPQRVGPLGDYRSYYTEELTDLVHRTWKREIDLFGFEFEKPRSRYAPRELTERTQAKKYVLAADQLV